MGVRARVAIAHRTSTHQTRTRACSGLLYLHLAGMALNLTWFSLEMSHRFYFAGYVTVVTFLGLIFLNSANPDFFKLTHTEFLQASADACLVSLRFACGSRVAGLLPSSESTSTNCHIWASARPGPRPKRLPSGSGHTRHAQCQHCAVFPARTLAEL